MKLIKTLVLLIGFTFMSTGCRHDHHEKTSSKTEKSDHSHATEKEDDEHRH